MKHNSLENVLKKINFMTKDEVLKLEDKINYNLPEEGACRYNANLEKYLKDNKRASKYDPNPDKKNYLAWNRSSWWPCNKTSKCIYNHQHFIKESCLKNDKSESLRKLKTLHQLEQFTFYFLEKDYNSWLICGSTHEFIYLGNRLSINCVPFYKPNLKFIFNSKSTSHIFYRKATESEISHFKKCKKIGYYVSPSDTYYDSYDIMVPLTNPIQLNSNKFYYIEHYYNNSTIKWIVSGDQNKGLYIAIKDKTYGENYCYHFGNNYKFREATESEKNWLLECSKIRRYVEYTEYTKIRRHIEKNKELNINQSNFKLNKNGKGETIKVDKLVSRISRRERPRGNQIRSRTRRASIKSRPISYTTSIIRS